jgi:hypothetical protein
MDSIIAILPAVCLLTIAMISASAINIVVLLIADDMMMEFMVAYPIVNLSLRLFMCIFPIICATKHPAIRRKAMQIFPAIFILFRCSNINSVQPSKFQGDAGEIYRNELQKMWS